MVNNHIANYLMKAEELASAVLWKAQFIAGKTLFIIDEYGKLVGYYHAEHTRIRYTDKLKNTRISDVCRKDAQYVTTADSVYEKAAAIFACYPGISVLPIVDGNKVVVDIIYRFQCFYREFYNSYLNDSPKPGVFPYPHYAHCICKAAETAKMIGCTDVSILEFGVAGGNGLVSCELHAREVSRLSGINFKIYGFDLGNGLPSSDDPKDIVEYFSVGDFPMNEYALREKLTSAELVLGDIRETVPAFLDKASPPPIGCMLVDVDYYSSTVPILNMLQREHDFFLPIIHMYFDDIYEEAEFQGEALAIKEFNGLDIPIKISPEFLNWSFSHRGLRRVKRCVRLDHPLYPKQSLLRDLKADFPLAF